MQFLKQSTASQTLELGPFLDDTDFKSIEGGLTIANTDIKIRKAGGTTHVNKNSGGATHIANGYYYATFDATDSNTVGAFDVHVNVAGALPVWHKFWVLEEAIYDALFGASAAGFDANQRVDVGEWLGTAVTLSATTTKPQVDVDSIDDDAVAANNAEAFFDNTGFVASASTIGTATNLTTNNDKTGYALSAAGVDAIWDEVLAAHTTADTPGKVLNMLTQDAVTLSTEVELGSILGQLLDDGTAWSFDRTADSLEAIRNTAPLGTAMRGTDNAALASVVGALADAAAAGDPTASDTVMQYVKQLVNLLAGTAGIATMPAAADPANGVNLFEMLRAAMGTTFATATDSLEQLQADLVTIQGDTDDIQTRLPAALVTGRMDSSMGAAATGVITADAIATDAIGSAELAASAAQKIRDEILPTQNAAFNNIEFLFVATSDGRTPVTGASGMGVTRSIDGGAFGAGTGTGPAEVGNGIYQYDASAADMNGGTITFRFTATGGTPGAPDDTFVTIVTGGGV